jgi:hypothetical protein
MVESNGKDAVDDAAWFSNRRTLVVLMIVLASSMSLPYFRKLNEWYPQVHPALLALVAGFFVTVVVYAPMQYGDAKYAFSNAVLLGLLVAEFVVYGAPFDFPAPVALSFFFFMFYWGREEADHLWPTDDDKLPTYKGKL